MARRHYSRSYWRLLFPLLLVLFYLGGGCAKLRTGLEKWVERTFGDATPREEYLWSEPFPSSYADRWHQAYRSALSDSLLVSLPHRERFVVDSSARRTAHSVNFDLFPGRTLTASIAGDVPLVFGELYRVGGPEPELMASWDTISRKLTYESLRIGGERLLMVVQAAPTRSATTFDLILKTEPSLLFPVAGKDRKSIRSFWGDRRDGGRRRHEGNDIFADRGTPLLAVADGRISRVREGGLGGKTVWLRDESRNLNYYYAHLSEQLVSSGQRVFRGDTIGRVGNSGNARTTPPHLHFGIYARGARDPLPYLLPGDPAPPTPREQPDQIERVPERGRHYLRDSAEQGENVIRQLEAGEAIVDLATTGRFHRIVTSRGELGYVNFD
jgi:murein DD-endopeptidase MepM/ murein hydrolase activator NlpD